MSSRSPGVDEQLISILRPSVSSINSTFWKIIARRTRRRIFPLQSKRFTNGFGEKARRDLDATPGKVGFKLCFSRSTRWLVVSLISRLLATKRSLYFREYLTEVKENDVRSSPLRLLVAATPFYGCLRMHVGWRTSSKLSLVLPGKDGFRPIWQRRFNRLHSSMHGAPNAASSSATRDPAGFHPRAGASN